MGTYNAGYTYYYGRHVFTNAQCRQQPHSDRRPRKHGGGEPLLPLWRAHGRQPQHRPATLQVHRKGAGPHPRPRLVRLRSTSLRPVPPYPASELQARQTTPPMRRTLTKDKEMGIKEKVKPFDLTSLLGYPDSNQERQDQNLQCYHYTISQFVSSNCLLLICDCKGSAFFSYPKTFCAFFQKKIHFSGTLYHYSEN